MLTGAPRATPLSATQQEGDDRPAQVIVRAAADRIGKENAAASVIDALENADIHWAWQLAHVPWDANEWLRFGISPGLKVAIAAELNRVDSSAPEISEQLRRFLLLPEQDGSPARRLYTVNASFFTLLTVSREERQHLTLTLFELLALVSGLMMPLPMSLLRHPTPADKGWTAQASVDDVTDAAATVILCALLFLTFISVACAMMTAAGGWRAEHGFYDAVVPVLGVCFHVLIYVCLLPLVIIVFWQGFIGAGSPYPMLIATLVALLLQPALTNFVHDFQAKGMALEMYHYPRWAMFFIRRVAAPAQATKLSDAALEPLAQKRAAELRERMGLAEPTKTAGRHVV